MAISDIPGYLQGFIFSDASADYYEPGIFKDQAGYGDPNSIEIIAGTPSFVTVNGQKGITLDNTVQGRFYQAAPWEICAITVMRPNIGAIGISLYPFQFSAAAATTGGVLRVRQVAASDFRHSLGKGTSTSAAICTFADAGLKVCAFDISQQDRVLSSSVDGVTVNAGSPIADAGNGNALAIGGNNGSVVDGIWCRFGNITGVAGNTDVSTDTVDVFEVHFFKRGLLTTHLANCAAEMAALSTKYGL